MPFTYITGSGTQQDPYSIGSIEAWQELVANCSSPNGSELTNSYMCLDTDLDFNDITGFENWSTNPPANLTGPMDSCDYDNRTWVYLREFNGNNHTIRGAYVYQDTNGEWSSWLSLIQVIGDPSIIRNIKFDHCYFYINTGANYDYEDSAGVIINGGYGHDVQYGGAPGRVSNIEVKNSVFNFTGRYYYPALIAADCVDHIYIDINKTPNIWREFIILIHSRFSRCPASLLMMAIYKVCISMIKIPVSMLRQASHNWLVWGFRTSLCLFPDYT